MAGGAEAFRNLAGLIGRIEKSVADMARLTVAASRVQDRAGIASGLRGQLQSAVTSPAMMRGLTEVLSQKLGGEATGEIKESVKRYNAAIRRVIQARDRETEATQQVSKLTVQRANIFQQSMPNLYRALLAGTATPQQMAAAQIFGGARFTNLTQRIQQAQQTTTQQAGIGMQQQQVARVWAQRGQQAALGPGGIPQAGGFLAGAGSAITAAGLGGMGTIAGSLFGHKGAAIGFIFDAAIGAVTRAFNELNKAVVGASRVIDRLSVWSFGGMRAAIMLMIAELHKEIQMSRELGKDMLAFGMAQKENIKAWTGFDIFIERLKLQLGELGAQIQTFIGNTLSSFVENTGLKEHPLRVGLPLAGAGIGAAWGGVAGFAAGGPLGGLAGAGAGALAGGGIGMVMVLGMKIYDLLKEWFGWDQGKDKGKEPVDTDLLKKLTPWEQVFNFANEVWKASRVLGQPNAHEQNLQKQLQNRAGMMGPPWMPGQHGVVPPGGPGGPGAAPWVPPVPPAMPPIGPPGGPPLPPPVNDAINQVLAALNAILRTLQGAPPPLGGGP